MVGKYILEKWTNGDYVSNVLRKITRENKRYFISDVQRYVRDWNEEPHVYTFVYKWATKFVKYNSELGFRRSISKRSNTDGVMTYTVSDDISTFKCEHTFSEVFDNDLREIQNPKNYPLAQMIRENERELQRDPTHSHIWKIELTELGTNEDAIGNWDNEIINYLKIVFKVNKVYNPIIDKIIEHKEKSIITKSGILFHINHFGDYKKEISFDDNYFNRTIMFWLFDDVLVFQYEDGKETF